VNSDDKKPRINLKNIAELVHIIFFKLLPIIFMALTIRYYVDCANNGDSVSQVMALGFNVLLMLSVTMMELVDKK
jgi:hypothetical protein